MSQQKITKLTLVVLPKLDQVMKLLETGISEAATPKIWAINLTGAGTAAFATLLICSLSEQIHNFSLLERSSCFVASPKSDLLVASAA